MSMCLRPSTSDVIRPLVAMVMMIVVTSAGAAESPRLVSGPELGLPSVWRVLFGFILVAIVAWGAVALLRRLKPWVPVVRGTPSDDVAIISHRQLARNLHVHIVETHHRRFMVVGSSHQVVVTPLDKDGTAPNPPAVPYD